MDQRIIISVLASYAIFLFLQTIIFRSIDRNNILAWIVRICAIGSISPLIFSALFTGVYPLPGYTILPQFLVLFVISFVLYGLLALTYILGPFGLIESSLRLKLLDEIAKAGVTGVDRHTLVKIYNVHDIIRKRLDRFLTSKDFVYRNGNYIINNRFSFFIFHTFVFENIKKIYLSGGIKD
jgi:hypothetical protein